MFSEKCSYQLSKKCTYNDEIWRDKKNKRNVLCCKKPIKTWNVNVDNIVISKSVKTKTNSKY